MSVIIDKINSLEGLDGKIALKEGEISISEKSLKLIFYADFGVNDEQQESIKRVVTSFLPSDFKTVNIGYEKIVAEKRFVLDEIKKYLSVSHRAVYDGVNTEKSDFVKNGYKVSVNLKVSPSANDYIKANKIDEELANYLKTRFVDDFAVTTTPTEEDSDLDFEYKPTENDLYRRERRTFKVDEVTRLFDNDTERECVYIADTKNYEGEAYVAGVINRIEERTTKTGKPFYLIEITDRTGTLTGMVFPTKANLPKVQKLAPSSEIIARGTFERRGEYINFTFRSINLCVFPKNFVPKQRGHRPCPKEYSLIFPKPLVVEEQDNFLVQKTVPECFKGRTFVVFDLETTGKDPDDKITEIGAVKMIDGVATEYFSTLVNPEKHIPQEVVDLTGITDDMVKDAPKFLEVCGDFYKFCFGSTLVAHNIEFDSRYIKKQGEAIDFYFDNPQMDTLALARESIFGVSNYKLNTLCDKFGIVFRHHRAYADAWATSELFVEIIRIRKSLPF